MLVLPEPGGWWGLTITALPYIYKAGMHKRKSSSFDDTGRSSLFGSIRKIRALQPRSFSSSLSNSTLSDLSGPIPEFDSAPKMPFSERIKGIISDKLGVSSTLNPRKSSSPVETSMGDRSLNGSSLRKSSLFSDASLDTHGFAVVGTKSLGIRARTTKTNPVQLKQVLLKQTLMQQYKEKQAAKERLLNQQIDLEEAEEEQRLKSDLNPLTPEQISHIQKCFARANQIPNSTVADAFRIELKFVDLATLRPGKWLNDNVIDMFLAMVTAKNPDKLFAFTTHFFTRLDEDGYSAVRRWAIRKKLNVFKPDFVFVPVNQGNMHWTLAVVNNREKRLEFYDSLPSRKGQHELKVLKGYLENEANRLNVAMPEYQLVPFAEGPRQSNGSDCGVFVCENVRRLSANLGLNYNQKNMPDVRLHMANSLIELGSKAKL